LSCISILWWPGITRFMSSPMLFHFISILSGYGCCGGGCFASLSIIASFINDLFQLSSTPYRLTHISSCITILSLLLKPQLLMIMKNAIFSNFAMIVGGVIPSTSHNFLHYWEVQYLHFVINF
jgi:hypothetical protein